MITQRIGLIGAGNMAQALIKGWLAGRLLAADGMAASDRDAELLSRVARTHGVATFSSNTELVRWADVVILAVKPQSANGVLREITAQVGPETLVVSIAAGIPTSVLERSLRGGVRVVRAMPNTPALVGAGATALCPGAAATSEDLELTRSLFEAVGLAVLVSEAQMDAVTGLSGSGPAYVSLMIEALADGGVKMGLPKPLALQLAAQTMRGTVELLQQQGVHPAALRDQVLSPAGTTIAGMYALEMGAVRAALMAAVQAAAERAAEIGEGFGSC